MIDSLNCAFYLSRSCLFERNVHQDDATVDFMGNQFGCAESATLISGIELTDCDGFYSGGPVSRICNPASRVDRRIDLVQSRLLLDKLQ